MNDQLNVHPKKNTRLIHVKTPLAIVNIWIGLTDEQGNRVERVEILPNNYAGEPPVTTEDNIRGIRIIEHAAR